MPKPRESEMHSKKVNDVICTGWPVWITFCDWTRWKGIQLWI
jgi:hypothetical protein